MLFIDYQSLSVKQYYVWFGVWWVMDQSLLVELLNYFLFQPGLHNWYNKGCVTSNLWDTAYTSLLIIKKFPGSGGSRFPLSLSD